MFEGSNQASIHDFLGISSQAIFLQRKFWTRPLADKYVNFQLVPAFRFCFLERHLAVEMWKVESVSKLGPAPNIVNFWTLVNCVSKSLLWLHN